MPALVLGMEQRFLKPPSGPSLASDFPVDFSARCSSPQGFLQTGTMLPDALPELRNSSSCRQESAQGWREAPEEALLLMLHKTSAPKSNYGQGCNYPFAWKMQHVLVGLWGENCGGNCGSMMEIPGNLPPHPAELTLVGKS